MNISTERFKAFFEHLKTFKELILIVLFFASGAAWTINYFATREQLESYRCINDLTLSMLVNTKSAEFLTQAVRSARKDLRATEELLTTISTDSPSRRHVVEQAEDQKTNLETLARSRDEAEKTKESAWKQLQAIQLGTSKPCRSGGGR